MTLALAHWGAIHAGAGAPQRPTFAPIVFAFAMDYRGGTRLWQNDARTVPAVAPGDPVRVLVTEQADPFVAATGFNVPVIAAQHGLDLSNQAPLRGTLAATAERLRLTAITVLTVCRKGGAPIGSSWYFGAINASANRDHLRMDRDSSQVEYYNPSSSGGGNNGPSYAAGPDSDDSAYSLFVKTAQAAPLNAYGGGGATGTLPAIGGSNSTWANSALGGTFAGNTLNSGALDMIVAEVVAWGGAADAAARTQIFNYARARWGI